LAAACVAVECAAAAVADDDPETPKMAPQNSFLNVTEILYYSVQSVILRGRLRQLALEPLNSATFAHKSNLAPTSPWNNAEGIKE